MTLANCAGRFGAATAVALALVACGGGSDEGIHDHEHTNIETGGRLVLIEKDSPAARVYELDTRNVLQTFTLANPPSAIYASPGKRYAMALQRTEGVTQVIDGGIWQEDHGDHLHDYRQAPQLSAFTIMGPRPTHYETHDALSLVFLDGSAEAGQNAGVRIFSDTSLGKGALEASLDLPIAMHGTAEPRGNYLLTTHRPPETTGTLPTQVDLYRRDGAGYAFVQRFEEPCPGLHGSFSNHDHSVFGCIDGVLVVTQQGETFTARKIANLPDIPADVRIGTIAGHHERPTMVGIASPGHLFEIDPAAGTMKRIAWAEGRTRRAHTFDREGANFLVVDDLGVTHVLDATQGFALRSSIATVSTMPAVAPFPAIAASGAQDKAFVTDPVGRAIAVVDLATLQVSEQLALDFSPSGLTWLGYSNQHAH